MNYESLLKFGIDQNASDIHLQAGGTPQLRIGGLIRNVEGPTLEAEGLRAFLSSIAPKAIAGDLDAALMRGARFTRTLDGVGRFRVGLYSHLGQPGAALRVIPLVPLSVEELNLPPVVRDVALARGGLTIVAGTLGSGRTATLAAMIDQINAAQYAKIVILGEPIEHLYARKKALVTLMEPGLDVPSFAHGLERALRLDPDVIAIDELTDDSTARLALRAAEAGRQVIATMTATRATQAIERLLYLVGSEAAAQLATTLEAILAQRLATTRDGRRRPAVEVLRGGPATAKALLDRRLADLRNLPAGRQAGMQTIEQHLVDLYRAGQISGTEAMRLANDPEAVAPHVRPGG
jgi:twitching motility protein PilT